MIETLTLKNFQSHKKSTLELCKGVNVIVGDSDAGKSAIIRALYWLAFGKPAGTSVMRQNVVVPTMVEATTADGYVQKFRNEKSGYYILNDQTYKGFGQAIPQPIVSFLNLGEINFMRQLDPLFLLSKSGGELAQYLNKLINLEVIDTSLSNIKQSVNAAKRNVSACEENIERLQKQLSDFDDLPEMEKAVQAVERLESKINKIEKAQNQIEEYLSVIKTAKAKVKQFSWVDDAVNDCDRLIELAIDISTVSSKKKQIELALERLKKAKTNIGLFKHISGLESELQALSNLHNKIQQIIEREDVIDTAINNIRAAARYANETIARFNTARKEFEAAKPEICPMCGQSWR